VGGLKLKSQCTGRRYAPPVIDEDIAIDGLLGIAHSPNTERRSA
jgi:hypothetical protein